MHVFIKIIFRLIVICLFLAAIPPANAQKPINGNGNIIEQVRPLSQFKSISLDFVANLVIVNGETPSFHIEGEDNILSYIGTRVRGGTLYISQDRWIEPTRPVSIRVGTPFITELTTSGYSSVKVENIKGPRMQINVGVGNATLQGTSGRIMIRTKTGKIDVTQLETKYVDVAVSSHGKVFLGSIEELVTNVSGQGKVIYAGEPAIKYNNDGSRNAVIHVDDYKVPEAKEVIYVSLTLVNNSRRRVNLRVEGPLNRNFGYGFTMNAAEQRREDWPVGTRVYAESGLLSDKLLLTVTEEMHREQVDIFTKE